MPDDLHRRAAEPDWVGLLEETGIQDASRLQRVNLFSSVTDYLERQKDQAERERASKRFFNRLQLSLGVAGLIISLLVGLAAYFGVSAANTSSRLQPQPTPITIIQTPTPGPTR